MKKKLLLLSFCFLSLASLMPASEAAATPNVVMAPTSDSVYVLQGNGFSDVSGLDVTVRYDASAVSSPRVVLGGLAGGALMAVNSATPGKVRFALVRATPMSGAGTIATVTFTRVASTGNDILSLSSLALISGKNIPITAQIVNSSKSGDGGTQAGVQPDTVTPPANPPVTTTNSTVDTNAGAAPPSPQNTGRTSTTGGGAGLLVVPVPATPDTKTAPGAPDQPATETAEKNVVREPDKTAMVEKPAMKLPEPEKKKVMAYQSVLEKFREYKGERTPQALMALFAAGNGTQEPSIALSDGKATIKVIVELNPNGENNNFLLDGVSLVSVSMINKEKNSWIVELLPDARSTEATISIPRNNQWSVMPLTVAPPLDIAIDKSAGKLNEADFRLFLKERGTAKAPKFDLNRDGVRDYIDDYIFTANYLMQQKGKDVLKKN